MHSIADEFSKSNNCVKTFPILDICEWQTSCLGYAVVVYAILI